MKISQRFSAGLLALAASIAARTFGDPRAAAILRRRDLESLLQPAPISRPLLHRAGQRAHLQGARRAHFERLRPLSGTPATRSDRGQPALLNRASRRAAAASLRYSS